MRLENMERVNLKIERIIKLLRRLADKAYRDIYVQTQTRQFLAQQMRAFRGSMSQERMGELLGMPQSVISRLENPTYGKWTLSTIFTVASKLNKAVIVRFIDVETFARFSNNVGDDAQNPASIDDKSIDNAIDNLEKQAKANERITDIVIITGSQLNGIQINSSTPHNDNNIEIMISGARRMSPA